MRANGFIMFVLNAFFSNICSSQCSTWTWATQSTGSNVQGNEVVSNNNLDIYSSGVYYNSNANFGTYSLSNWGASDFYLAKFDQNGNVIWANRGGGSGYDAASSMVIDKAGNIYTAGYFQSTTFFLAGQTINNASSLGNTTDMLIIKYDDSGNIIWYKTFGGTSSDSFGGIALDSSGNILLTGYYESLPASFGGITLSNPGAFIAKMDTSGNIIWAKGLNSTNATFSSLTCDEQNNSYVLGTCYMIPVILGSDTIVSSSGGNANIFIAKYDSSGSVLWAKRYGGTGPDLGSCIRYDHAGSLYMSGQFQSPSFVFGNSTLTNAVATGNSSDIFLLKIDTSGIENWGRAAGGSSSNEVGFNIRTSSGNRIYMTGIFKSSSINFGSYVLLNNGVSSFDSFMVLFDSSGYCLWAESLGDVGNDYGQAVTTDLNGDVIFTGHFQKNINIGPFGLSTSGTCCPNLYLAKISCPVLGDKEELDSMDFVSVYPNPSDGRINIDWEKFSDTIYSFELFDVNGALVDKFLHSLKPSKLNITIEESGMYYLRIYHRNGVIIKKIVIL